MYCSTLKYESDFVSQRCLSNGLADSGVDKIDNFEPINNKKKKEVSQEKLQQRYFH